MPSPTGSETVQIAFAGGVWMSASRTVAEAECVRTVAPSSRGAKLDRDRCARPLASVQDRLRLLLDEAAELVGLEEA